jgi:hypothetical protein
MKTVVKHAAINALATFLYVILVASFIYFLGQILPGPDNKTVLIPIAMLMLFVFSAALTGFLVLGRPVMWYLDGKKKEAVSLLLYTIGFLFVITLIVFIFLITLTY